MKIIDIKNINKYYGKKHVLKDINLEVNKGEVVAIVGPNGTGKTTLMEILMTLRKADSGEAKVLGYDCLTKYDEIRKKIGVVLQEGGMYNYIKLKEALDLFASYYNVSQERVNKLIEEFELQNYMNIKFNKMSGGWKQRFLLAIAFLQDPELIFLDEPTTGLDPKASQILWDKIKGNEEKGRTIILTTHSMEEVEKFCNRAVIINNGAIVANDTPNKLKEKLDKRFFSEVYFSYINRRDA